MNNSILVLFCAVLGSLFSIDTNANELCQDAVMIIATIESNETPVLVKVDHEGLNYTELQTSTNKPMEYKGCIQMPDFNKLEKSTVLQERSTILACWKSKKESLPLTLHPSIEKQLRIKIFHVDETAYNHDTMQEIEMLPGDALSQFEKYFRGKNFYYYWLKKDPLHSITLRSAKAWFDAAIKLALLKNSPIAMDESVANVMKDYELQSEKDSALSERLRKYVKKHYTEEMLKEVQASQFAFVGDFPRMIKKRSDPLEHVSALNSHAIAALSSFDNNERKIVADKQGITLEVLEKNDAYFNTLQNIRKNTEENGNKSGSNL